MGLNTIKGTGNWGGAASDLNNNFATITTEIEKLKAANVKFKGYYTSEATLKAVYSSPAIGDNAWVGATYPGTVYECKTAGTWSNTTKAPSTPSVQLADYATKTLVDVRTTEYNVSVQHPTSGIDSTNKYTLSGAIALVPSSLRTIGLKCSFLGEAGKVQTWEYQGGMFAAVGSWVQQVRRGEVDEIEEAINILPFSGIFETSHLFEVASYRLNDYVNLLYTGFVPSKSKISFSVQNSRDEITFLYAKSKGVFSEVTRIPAGQTSVNIVLSKDYSAFKIYSTNNYTANFTLTIESLSISDINQNMRDIELNKLAIEQNKQEMSYYSSSIDSLMDQTDLIFNYSLENMIPYKANDDVNIYYNKKIAADTQITIELNEAWAERIVLYAKIDGKWIATPNRIIASSVGEKGVWSGEASGDWDALKYYVDKSGISATGRIILPSTTAIMQKEINQNKQDIVDLKNSSKAAEIAEYFKDEVKKTGERIAQLATGTSVVLNIVTDTHERYWIEDDTRCYNETFDNIKAVNAYRKSDALLHLGDMLVSNQTATGKYDRQEVVNEHLRMFWHRMTSARYKSLIVLGNHDGLLGGVPTANGSYAITGMFAFCERPKDKPYFYFDNVTAKVRCICLCAPFIEEGKSTWSFGREQTEWLIDTALRTEDNWHVLFFSHTPLFSSDMTAGDYGDISGIINAYNNHVSFATSNGKVADFTTKVGTKSVAWICGHEHYDMIVTDNSVYANYNLVCPIIITSCNYRYGATGTVSGATYPSRVNKSVTQDLWDTLVYRKDLGMMYMVRFGAGDDREVKV